MHARYLVGIDLGTTHTALRLRGPVRHIPAAAHPHDGNPQTVRPGHAEARVLLPSCVYLPAENELPEGSLGLPWNTHSRAPKNGIEYTVGELARARGSGRSHAAGLVRKILALPARHRPPFRATSVERAARRAATFARRSLGA